MAIVLQLSTAATADGEVDATLQKASADLKITALIVWRVTDHVAAIQYNFTNHISVMYSFCLPLLDFGKEANKNASAHSTLQLIKDKGVCIDMYREKIIKLNQTNCRNVSDLVVNCRQSIQKRQVQLLYGLGVKIVVSFKCIGQ